MMDLPAETVSDVAEELLAATSARPAAAAPKPPTTEPHIAETPDA
jgi:hypothetical protein